MVLLTHFRVVRFVADFGVWKDGGVVRYCFLGITVKPEAVGDSAERHGREVGCCCVS